MNFFISENIFSFNSGTEHAQIKRTKLFNAFNDAAKYVTRNYNRLLDRDLKAVGLTPDVVLNMYDFFQGTTDIKRVEQNLRLLKMLPLDTYHIVADGPNQSFLNHNGRRIATITVMPETVGLVNEVIFEDRAGNPTIRENWDWRGFKSSVDTFHPDGSLATQRFLNLNGDVVLEITHMAINGLVQPTMWQLLNYRGHHYRFNSENELLTFFLNEIVKKYQEATLISDRRTLDEAVGKVSGAKQKFAYFHDIHTPDVVQPRLGEPYPVYEIALSQKNQLFDAILVPTDAQRHDIKARYPNLNVKTAPDTFISQSMLTQSQTSIRNRVNHRILFLGRLSPEKNPEAAVQVLAVTRRYVNDATLEFMGYPANTEIVQKLQQLARDLGVESSVIFTPYGNYEAVKEALSRAQVIIETSHGEGFGMNLVEALAFGLPIVSYRINYTTTTHEIVENNRNGYVVPTASANIMAQRVASILNDPSKWASMSTASYQKAKFFSAEKIYNVWQQVFKN
ncbi:glycosyltransferase [Leuconostoc pseudomesenteroides]|uniref:glycosyltransferase n=1 Tax=Leuconostoc pseudomesenteroides TaxID=33968 RepID=UPI00403DDBB0